MNQSADSEGGRERGRDEEGMGIVSNTLDPDSGFLLTSRSRCSTPGHLTPSGIDLYGDLLTVEDDVRRAEEEREREEGGRERKREGEREENNIDGFGYDNLIVAALLRQDNLGTEMNI